MAIQLVLYSIPMKLHTHSLHWIARFLLAAVLLQALAPAWAGVRGSADKPLLEICTAVGTQWIKQGAQSSDQSSSKPSAQTSDQSSVDQSSVDHSTSHKHCVFCASTAAVDSFDASALLVNHTSSDVVSPSAMPLVGIFSGHRIRSRAPPL